MVAWFISRCRLVRWRCREGAYARRLAVGCERTGATGCSARRRARHIHHVAAFARRERRMVASNYSTKRASSAINTLSYSTGPSPQTTGCATFLQASFFSMNWLTPLSCGPSRRASADLILLPLLPVVVCLAPAVCAPSAHAALHNAWRFGDYTQFICLHRARSHLPTQPPARLHTCRTTTASATYPTAPFPSTLTSTYVPPRFTTALLRFWTPGCWRLRHLPFSFSFLSPVIKPPQSHLLLAWARASIS